MSWLKEHSFLATWISPVLAIIIAIWRTKDIPKLSDINWTWFTVYVTFVTSFGVVVSPMFDPAARQAAQTLLFGCFGAIILGAARRRPPNA
jgi:hypothetical protein